MWSLFVFSVPGILHEPNTSRETQIIIIVTSSICQIPFNLRTSTAKLGFLEVCESDLFVFLATPSRASLSCFPFLYVLLQVHVCSL